jgi:hypothetical protein
MILTLLSHPEMMRVSGVDLLCREARRGGGLFLHTHRTKKLAGEAKGKIISIYKPNRNINYDFSHFSHPCTRSHFLSLTSKPHRTVLARKKSAVQPPKSPLSPVTTKKFQKVDPQSSLLFPLTHQVRSGAATPRWRCLCRIASLEHHLHCLGPRQHRELPARVGSHRGVRTGHLGGCRSEGEGESRVRGSPCFGPLQPGDAGLFNYLKERGFSRKVGHVRRRFHADKQSTTLIRSWSRYR